MKITELDLQTEGKRYKYDNQIFTVKDGDLVDIESNTYLRKENISITELLKMNFEEIKEMKNPYKRVERGDKYHSMFGFRIHSNTDNNDEFANKLFSTANYFNNKAYAEYIAFKETLMRKLDKFAWEHNETVINWNDCSPNYYIAFDNGNNELIITCCMTYQANNIYFTSREIAEQALEKFKDDLIKLYTWEFKF